MFVLGEAVKVCADDPSKIDLDVMVGRIQQSKQSKLVVYVPELDSFDEFSNVLGELRQEMAGVGPMDLIHLAHALTDKSARGLLTFDEGMISNPGMARMKRKPIWPAHFRVANESGI